MRQRSRTNARSVHMGNVRRQQSSSSRPQQYPQQFVWRTLLSPLACALLVALALAVAGLVGSDRELSTLAAPPESALARVATDAQASSFSGPAVRMGATPTTLRWSDPTQHTALYVTWRAPTAQELSILFDNTPAFPVRLYSFAFTLPGGDQIVGAALGEPTNTGDGSESLISNDHLALDGATGAVVVSIRPVVSLDFFACGLGQTTSAGQPVIFSLDGRISADGLAAFGALAFALGAQPTSSLSAACVGKLPTSNVPGAAIMRSGCPPSASANGCDTPMPSAGATVNAFDQAIINHNWAAAYGLCAPDITRQYGEGGFAATMIQQSQAQGNITAISAPTTITLAFTVGGQAFFTVQQQTTYDHGGQTSVRTLTSYYLLDDEAWRFWFSK